MIKTDIPFPTVDHDCDIKKQVVRDTIHPNDWFLLRVWGDFYVCTSIATNIVHYFWKP